MDQTSIYFCLVWIAIALARPQESEDAETRCASFFQGQTIPLDERIKERLEIDTETENQWKTQHLTYKCVQPNVCNDEREKANINSFGSISHSSFGKEDVLNSLIESAQNAECPEKGARCCSTKFISTKETCDVQARNLGDGYCDDEANNEACNFDKGDCCLLDSESKKYCNECLCKVKEEPKTC